MKLYTFVSEDILPGSQVLLQAPEDSPDYIESPMYNERVVSSHRITYNIYVPIARRVISLQVSESTLELGAGCNKA